MIEFTQILCPTDFSEASVRPLTYAAALARWYGARLTVLHVVPTFDLIPVRSPSLDGAFQMIEPPSRDQIMAELRQAVDVSGAGGESTALATETGDPAKAIVDCAADIGADLIVMGTHGRGGFERLVVGSITEKVLRKAPCPVLTVPPHAPAGLPAEVRFKTILCPMDFSPAAMQAYGYALDLGRQADGVVTILHVVEWLPEEEPRTYAHFNVPGFRNQLVQDARQRLHALIAEEPQTWSAIQEVVVGGRAHREILRLATESSTELIVMGSQGRGAVGLALFGSTTHQVVRAAACPVLVVRAPEVARVR